MKIVPVIKNITFDDLYNVLRSELNPIFQQRRLQDIILDVIKEGDTIKILQPKLYEDYLYKLIWKGNTLEVHESEHYVDDINALTIGGILDELFIEHLGATAPQI
ncbi:hypothetical protein EOD41_13395 [Mucilaginibacter limnophilus]|uniref:Uncharacterized protein n=1 Tax=Mucilaginibacter limnophilus TaxID=1932778 RepID=A0A437MS53_9SPHI|nr:hypothetical protein [Mucilaginibacter limnophilus]RVU00466.1 hypothetical protein EOD41_13395 [Mucilaginibacter limnophilus]